MLVQYVITVYMDAPWLYSIRGFPARKVLNQVMFVCHFCAEEIERVYYWFNLRIFHVCHLKDFFLMFEFWNTLVYTMYCMVHCQMLQKIKKRYSFYLKWVNPVLFIKTSSTVDVMFCTSIQCMFIWLHLFFLTKCVFFQKSLHTTEEFCDKGVPPIWNTASDESYRLSNKITCQSRVYQFNWPTCISGLDSRVNIFSNRFTQCHNRCGKEFETSWHFWFASWPCP